MTKNTHVYVVIASSYDTYEITRIFSSRASAQRYLESQEFTNEYRDSDFNGGGFFAWIDKHAVRR